MNIKKYAPIPYWLGIVIALIFAGLFTLKSYLMWLRFYSEEGAFNAWRNFGVHTVNFGLWALLLPLLNYWVERFRIQSSIWRVKLIAIGLSILTSFFHEFCSSYMYQIPWAMINGETVGMKTFWYVVNGLNVTIPNRLLEYWIIYAILTALQMQKKYRKKELELAQVESQLSNARLNALRLQLQPHFLFNTLNTISSLMEINVDAGQKVVSRLGGLLRFVLDKDDRQFVPLREELEFVRNYLDIEQTRFHDRLSIHYQIDESTMETFVPHLILQPLMENAIKHGFSKHSGAGKIEVISRQKGDQIELLIRDDGAGTELSQSELLQAGIGLSNVKKRLDLLYKGTASFTIDTKPDAGFVISILLPKQAPFEKSAIENID